MLDKYISRPCNHFIYSANNNCLGWQIMKFPSKLFSHLSLAFFLLDTSILLITHFSCTLYQHNFP